MTVGGERDQKARPRGKQGGRDVTDTRNREALQPLAERRAADHLRRDLAARKTAYAAAIVFSVLIWATAEGFGGPYTSGASDIGTAVIYAVVFAALLALSYYSGPGRLSADRYLEQRISWWWRVAEVRRPAAQLAAAASPQDTTAGQPRGA
jgi:hypothetical protein